MSKRNLTRKSRWRFRAQFAIGFRRPKPMPPAHQSAYLRPRSEMSPLITRLIRCYQEIPGRGLPTWSQEHAYLELLPPSRHLSDMFMISCQASPHASSPSFPVHALAARLLRHPRDVARPLCRRQPGAHWHGFAASAGTTRPTAAHEPHRWEFRRFRAKAQASPPVAGDATLAPPAHRDRRPATHAGYCPPLPCRLAATGTSLLRDCESLRELRRPEVVDTGCRTSASPARHCGCLAAGAVSLG